MSHADCTPYYNFCFITFLGLITLESDFGTIDVLPRFISTYSHIYNCYYSPHSAPFRQKQTDTFFGFYFYLITF